MGRKQTDEATSVMAILSESAKAQVHEERVLHVAARLLVRHLPETRFFVTYHGHSTFLPHCFQHNSTADTRFSMTCL